jgi:electron transport complex protein RnfB
MRDLKHDPRKKPPKLVAVIYADRCTGCDACIEVCPVDCIAKVQQHPETPGLQAFCEIDWDRCIGFQLCVRLPKARTDPYRLTVCPWDAIGMVPLTGLIAMVDRLGGPPADVSVRGPARLASAQRQANLVHRGTEAD